jgi:quinol monooxygenase YgiN
MGNPDRQKINPQERTMSTPLTIVARIEAKTEQLELVKTELLKLVAPTLKEAGCIQYDLHQDNENPAVFLFYENWESRSLWQAHMDNAHLAEYVKATEGAIASFTVNEMTKCAPT